GLWHHRRFAFSTSPYFWSRAIALRCRWLCWGRWNDGNGNRRLDPAHDLPVPAGAAVVKAAPVRRGARWLKFNLVGALGIGVQLGVLILLTRAWHFGYIVATPLAVEAAVLHNFVWHERFTWIDKGSRNVSQALLRFLWFDATTGVVSIGGNLLLMR